MPQKPPARNPATAKRHAGLRALAVSLPRVTKRAFGKRGFAEGGLAADWPGIVGAELATRCRPGKLTFARAAERRDGTLTLRVEAPFATEVQHIAPQIMERINGHFGYRMVARLLLKQVAYSPRPANPPAKPEPAPEITPELAARLESVEDPELRAALGRLGRAFGPRPDRAEPDQD
jgi:hypothetical protein